MNSSQTYGTRKISELIDMGITVPDWQRLTSQKHIDSIYNFIKEYVDSWQNQPVLPGCFTLCSAVIQRQPFWWLIDGQHRFLAMHRLLQDDDLDCVVMCCNIQVSDENQAHEYFRIVNTSLPLKRPPRNSRLTVPNEVIRQLKNMFPNIFKDTENPRRPHLNARHFAEKLLTRPEIQNQNAESIIAKLLEYNQKICAMPLSEFKYPGDKKDRLDKIKQQAIQKGNFFLGMYKNYEFLGKSFSFS